MFIIPNKIITSLKKMLATKVQLYAVTTKYVTFLLKYL